jgi:hypothetical protein
MREIPATEASRNFSANEHAALLAHVQRTGIPRGRHDLIIAATARTADRMCSPRTAGHASAICPTSMPASSPHEC